MYHQKVEICGVNTAQLKVLSEEEKRLVHLYRRSRTLPESHRKALHKTLELVVLMYLELAGESRARRKKGDKK